MVWSAVDPSRAGAQEPQEPPSAGEEAEEPVEDEAATDEEGGASEEEAPEEIVTEDAEGKEWITPDVAAAEEEQEELEEDADVDEVIIEYGESPDLEQDTITDAEGREVPDVEVPVVSKAVEVQDPDKLEPGADKDTGVQGQVVSRRPKKVLPDAPVLARGKQDGRVRSTITDERGRYRLYLPPGRYTLRSYYDLYHGARWDNIDVQRGAFRRVNFVLDPITERDAGVEEMEVVYLADTSSEQAQLNIRKETVTVQDAISAEEIKRAGDSTARSAVARVVGVTVDEGGRVIIRGLAGRYNQILLNKMPVPGVDPDIPSVKLDVFPTSVVSNLSVVKSPVPTLPGAFAGGLLLIDTNNYPREFEFKVSVSAGANSISTFRDAPTYQGGRFDWTGFDDGIREIPRAVGGQRLDTGAAGSGSRYQTLDQVNQVGRQFPNVWNPTTRRALPNLGFKASLGTSGNLNKEGRRGGFLVSLLYDYGEKIRTGFNRRFRFGPDGNADATLEDFDLRSGIQEVLWGTFGSAFIEFNPDNFVNFTTLFSRAMDDTTITQLGSREDTGLERLQTKNSYNFIGRSVFFNQLTGDHRNLGDSKARLEWNLSGGTGRRNEPDRREVQQFIDTQLVTDATRFYADLEQWFLQGQTNVRFPLYEAFEGTAYAEIGVLGGFQDRSFVARRFQYRRLNVGRLIGDPEILFGPENLGVISTMREVTNIDDSYEASNLLLGGYAQLETPIAPWLSFLGLLRFEMFRQEVQSQSPFAQATPGEVVRGTDRTDVDPMPSANFRFKINNEMFVRLGYGMTVIRPAIRELAPFLYIDFIRGWNITGNADLLRTRVQNAEARYEYFFGGTDLIAVTAFFKYLDKPIEFVVTNQVNNTATFNNADFAWLVGGELELRFGFGRLHEKLDKLFFVGNVAVMQSRTFISADAAGVGASERPLFNQSPYVTNLSLRFDDPDSGILLALVYNAFGPRIVEAGTSVGEFVTPDVFEQPQHLLDLIVSWQPTDHVKLGLKWKNIAFARRRYKQGDQLVLVQDFGTSVGLSAEYIY